MADRLLVTAPQNWPLPRETRYVELFVVTDSTEVPPGAGAGQGPGWGQAEPEGLSSFSSGSWGAERPCAGGCWRW